jgi:decaprenyl-phosphate phosphoribosyltransferase
MPFVQLEAPELKEYPVPPKLEEPKGLLQHLWPYIQIARVDHWFKNAFMLLGVLLAFFYQPALLTWGSVPLLGLALLATCLIASSNYVINELIDAPHDRMHPVKKHRPVPSGLVRPPLAVVEWLVLGITGIAMAGLLNAAFMASGAALWVMGIVYNIPPLRSKELPYLDVLSESVNNPLRLFLGWFALVPGKLPPLSLTLAYWMVGAFFMATKRFAEYRRIGNAEQAAQYRKSFGYYTEERLLVSMFFYATLCALMAGIFLVRYHVELILFVPVAAGFFAYYLKLGLQDDSPVQNPEKLPHEKGFLLYVVCSVLVFVLLMYTHVPAFYELFNVEASHIDPLWTLGRDTKNTLP